MLRISEIFGPTWQGEGPTAGRYAAFIRLAGCNLDCSWCDTPYSWDWKRYNYKEQVTERSVSSVLNELHEIMPRGGYGVSYVFTGGEPLLQQSGMADLARRLPSGAFVEVETNGTISPNAATIEVVDQFNVSPKLANSGVPFHRRIKDTVISDHLAHGKAIWKFVCQSTDDVSEVRMLVDWFGLRPQSVWVMPEGTDQATTQSHANEIRDAVLAHSFNLTMRQHVTIWDGARGH